MSITAADESLKAGKRVPSSVLGIFLVTHAIDNRSQSPAFAGLFVGATESHRSYSQQGAGKRLSQFNSNFLRAIDPSRSGTLDLQTLNPSREQKMVPSFGKLSSRHNRPKAHKWECILNDARTPCASIWRLEEIEHTHPPGFWTARRFIRSRPTARFADWLVISIVMRREAENEFPASRRLNA